MLSIPDSIDSIDGAAPGRRCKIRPTLGRSYREITIEYGNLQPSQIKNITLKMQTSQQQISPWTFRDLNDLIEYNRRLGRPIVPGQFTIYFCRPEIKENEIRDLFSLGTAGLDLLTVEFDIDQNASNPLINAWAERSANKSVVNGLYTVIVEQATNSKSGPNFNDDIPLRDRLLTAHILNNEIDNVLLEVDGSTAFKLPRSRNEYRENAAGLKPYGRSRGFTIDYFTHHRLADALTLGQGQNTVNSARLTTTLANSSNRDDEIRYWFEYVVAWDSLTGASFGA